MWFKTWWPNHLPPDEVVVSDSAKSTVRTKCIHEIMVGTLSSDILLFVALAIAETRAPLEWMTYRVQEHAGITLPSNMRCLMEAKVCSGLFRYLVMGGPEEAAAEYIMRTIESYHSIVKGTRMTAHTSDDGWGL